MFSDPMSDMLTRLRNASLAKKREVFIPFSKPKLAVAKILKKEGYVVSVDETSENGSKEIKVVLKYHENGIAAFTSLKRISTPGRRMYVRKDRLPVVLNNLGVAIVSTPQGMMTNREAKRAGLGGEVICEVF